MIKKLVKYSDHKIFQNYLIFSKNKYSFTEFNKNDYHVSQSKSFDEELILVDEKDNKIGSITKLDGKIVLIFNFYF